MLSHSSDNYNTPTYGDVKLNEMIVWQSAFKTPNIETKRGVNIGLVNTCNCSVPEPFLQFDMYADASAGTRLNDYLQQVDHGTVIIGVSADSPTDYTNNRLQQALPALDALGVDVSDVEYRGAFGFVAQKGMPGKTVFRKAPTAAEGFNNPPHFNVTVAGKPTSQLSYGLVVGVQGAAKNGTRTNLLICNNYIESYRDNYKNFADMMI